jgi:hypothetical protein
MGCQQFKIQMSKPQGQMKSKCSNAKIPRLVFLALIWTLSFGVWDFNDFTESERLRSLQDIWKKLKIGLR